MALVPPIRTWMRGLTVPPKGAPTAETMLGETAEAWGSQVVMLAGAGAAVAVTARATGLTRADLLGALHPRHLAADAALTGACVGAWVATVAAENAWKKAIGSPGGFPSPTRADTVRLLVLMGPIQFSTAVVEEVLMVAVPAVWLGAAGRPVEEAAALSTALRLIPHAYQGPSAVAMAPMAAGSAALYWHTGRVGPLIAAHMIFNVCVTGKRLRNLPPPRKPAAG